MEERKSPAYFRGTESATVIKVIKTVAWRGDGTQREPFRRVIQYWTFDGNLIGEDDPKAIIQQE